MAARQPVLVVVEDVHWSDPTTCEFLDLLINRVAELRVLLIITFRPGFYAPWSGLPDVILISPGRLSRQNGAEIIAEVAGANTLPKEVADQILDRADGVPLFIEELSKSVVESGLEAGGGYAPKPATALVVPTTLQGSLLARLYRLDQIAPTRGVAQIGSALGRRFSYELISSVAGIPKRQLDEASAIG